MTPAQEAIAKLKAAGYTLPAIAERVGSSRPVISNVKRGLTACPVDLERRLVRAAAALPNYSVLVSIRDLIDQ